MDLFDKNVDRFYKIQDIFNKIMVNKIVDLLFREGGSLAPREPPLATGLKAISRSSRCNKGHEKTSCHALDVIISRASRFICACDIISS